MYRSIPHMQTTYMQSFIISHSSCAEQYGDMSADTQSHTYIHTHSHTNKPPTVGVRLVGHTSIKLRIHMEARWLSDRIPDSRSREHRHESPTHWRRWWRLVVALLRHDKTKSLSLYFAINRDFYFSLDATADMGQHIC